MSQTTNTSRFESQPVDNTDYLFEGEPVWDHDQEHDPSFESTPEHEVNDRLQLDDPYAQPDPSALNQMVTSWYDTSNVGYGTYEMTDDDMVWQPAYDQFDLPDLEGIDPNWGQLENNIPNPHVLTQPTPAVISDRKLLEGSPPLPPPPSPSPQALRLPEPAQPAQPAASAQGSSTTLPSVESLNLADRLKRMQKRRRTKPQKPRPRPAAAENQVA